MTQFNSTNHAKTLCNILTWYQELGVDEAISDHPINWYDWSKRPLTPLQNDVKTPAFQTQKSFEEQKAKLSPAKPKNKQAKFASQPHDAAVMSAREKASHANSLEDLYELIANFQGCNLKATAKNTCISRGSKTAKLMFIGEAPGRDEDLQGTPFVGRAGQLLDKMLKSINCNESNVYITNIVYWRPPGNRAPTLQEMEICRPFLERQIELINPKLIVFLGGVAAKHLLNTTQGIMRLRGKWKSIQIGKKDFPCLATLHPAYLLRSPVGKKQAWQDLLAIQSKL